jgi:sugar phosphate isomerase/epimerase
VTGGTSRQAATLGIFARTFPGTDAQGVLRQARDAGFASVQYNMACSGLNALPTAVPSQVLQALSNASDQSQVTLAALSATYNIIHPDHTKRAAGLGAARVLAAAASAVGVPILTLCSGSRSSEDQWAPHPENRSARAWRDLLEGMRALIALAEEHDLTLGLEPEPANVVESASRARELIEQLGSPRVGIVLDAANLVEPVLRESVEVHKTLVRRAVDLLADRIVLVHAKDRALDGRVVAPGQGIIDFHTYFHALASAGVRVPVITHGLAAGEARATFTFLAERLNAAGFGPT